MQGLLRISGCTLFLLTTPAIAADVFRCEDSEGHITFTLQGCSADQLMEVQSAHNSTPSNGKPVAMASFAQQKSNPPPTKNLTVVAEKQNGCSNRVIGTQRRTAIIRKQIQVGMTQDDVESALGKPDEEASHNGETRYSYKDNNGKKRQINFDQNGCVKAKR